MFPKLLEILTIEVYWPGTFLLGALLMLPHPGYTNLEVMIGITMAVAMKAAIKAKKDKYL